MYRALNRKLKVLHSNNIEQDGIINTFDGNSVSLAVKERAFSSKAPTESSSGESARNQKATQEGAKQDIAISSEDFKLEADFYGRDANGTASARAHSKRKRYG
eukprot:jgi/Bigna1/144588/aug1.89_g19296